MPIDGSYSTNCMKSLWRHLKLHFFYLFHLFFKKFGNGVPPPPPHLENSKLFFFLMKASLNICIFLELSPPSRQYYTIKLVKFVKKFMIIVERWYQHQYPDIYIFLELPCWAPHNYSIKLGKLVNKLVKILKKSLKLVSATIP